MTLNYTAAQFFSLKWT